MFFYFEVLYDKTLKLFLNYVKRNKFYLYLKKYNISYLEIVQFVDKIILKYTLLI